MGPASGASGGGAGAAPAGEEGELLARTDDRAELARRAALQQADHYRQDRPAPGEGPAGQGDASSQVFFGRAHRVARLDTQNQVVGQTLKEQVAATRPTSGEAADAEPAQSNPSQLPPAAGGRQQRDGSRQAFAMREAGQAPNAVPDTDVDAVEIAEKAKQRDDGFGRDLSLAQSHAQAVLPQAARQQRVLFVLRTVPSVQAAASRPPVAAPAAAAAEASAAPEADAASEGRPAPQGEAHRGTLPAAPSAEPAP